MATAEMDTFDAATLQAMLGPQLTTEQATLIFQQGQEAVVFALLSLAKQLAEKRPAATIPDPSTPSGQTPALSQNRRSPDVFRGQFPWVRVQSWV
jgi:transposase